MKTNEELLSLLRQGPRTGGPCWRHKKSGNLYRVVRRCLIEATLEPAVVYSPVGNSALVWCRPLSEWNEKFEPVSEGA